MLTRDINEYHEALGHPSASITCATAHAECISLKKFSIPVNTVLSSKKTVPRSTNKGERLFIDISSTSTKSMGGNNIGHWLWMISQTIASVMF